MTNSHPSSSDGSKAFSLLDPVVQHWIWDQKWDELRDIQEHSIHILLESQQDVIISAATASGKTEAAFLPICSRLSADRKPSIQALYLAPLKALINDQFLRLDSLCDRLDLPVTRWHGDVLASIKRKCVTNPKGILLTTPESLEAICVTHGPDVARMFAHLSHVVIDELHAFIGTERGRQLQSLIHRLESAIGSRPQRVGLSATLGDLSLAATYLRHDDPMSVDIITSDDSRQELRAQIRGYLKRAGGQITAEPLEEEVIAEPSSQDIAQHIFGTLRLTSNLIFANSRATVETYAALLASLCEDSRLSVNFFPHHGNLSKELREDVERMLKAGDRPVNVVATSTLELGIDIGAMDSVAQIGTPNSVAGLRQRMGRSGRRGQPAAMRVYIEANEITPNSSLLDNLRLELVQAIAVLSLLIEGWCEPPSDDGLHLSTLVQQVLSLVAQYGGAGAPFLWRILCETGPFKNLTTRQFSAFLRGLGERDIIAQTEDGTIVLAPAGERLVNHYSFYAAFSTPEEYRVFHNGKSLGTLPIDSPVITDSFIIFAGRRWKVISVDTERKTIDLAVSRGGRVPRFRGEGPMVNDRIRAKMVEIYLGTSLPPFLDLTARLLLAEARTEYQRFKLETKPLVQSGKDVYLFHWSGDRIGYTLALILVSCGLKAANIGPAICAIDTTPEQMWGVLRSITEHKFSDPLELLKWVPEKRIEKFDRFVADDLLELGYLAKMFDLEAARRVIHSITRQQSA